MSLPFTARLILICAIALCLAPATASAAITATQDAPTVAQALMADPSNYASASWQQKTGGTPAATATEMTGMPIANRYPTSGTSFAILSSGDATLAGNGQDSNARISNGGNSTRGSALDVTILRVDVTVPAGANCLALDFTFLSEEFPTFVGQQYNDGFVAELDTNSWTAGGAITAPNNFAKDGAGNVVSINSTGVAGLSAGAGAGTVYGGATNRLAATTPITPGAHAIYLSIFDQGDFSYDTAVFLDNLRIGTVANPAEACQQGTQTAPPPELVTPPANTPPAVAIAGEAERTYGEGETERIFEYTVTDAGDTFTVETSCGAAGEKVSDDGATLKCLFRDGGAASTVSVKATDSKSAVGEDTVAVTVNNTAPSTPEVSGLSETDSDDAHNWTFKADDPAPADDPGIDYLIDWDGDGTVDQTVENGGNEEIVAHTFATPCECTIKVTAKDKDDGSSETASFPVKVWPWLEPALAGAPDIAEGDGVSLDASGSDGELAGDLTYDWDVDGDGDFGDATGAQPTLTWSELVAAGVDDGPAEHAVKVNVTDGVRTKSASTTLDVANTAPTITQMVAPAPELVAKTAYPWTFAATDPSPVDQDSLEFAVDWEDGLTDTAASPPAHAWAIPGEYLVTAKALDKDTGASAEESRDVFVGGFVDGFVEGFGRTFMVGGTTGGDSMNVKRVGTSVVITVLGQTPKTYTIPSTVEILLFGGAGDDTFLAESSVLQQVTVMGGAGNDTIDVRSPNSVGVGGPGDDKVLGNDFGRDLLFGGEGLDTLDGKGGEDLLVAGRVPWERANLKARKALESLQLEWLRSTVVYRTRVAHLDGTSSGALNTVFLRASDPDRTVFDDISIDSLTGGAGNDWLIANRLAPGTIDAVIGTAEALNELTP